MVHPIAAQYSAVTIGRLIKPIYLHGLSDGLCWDAMIRRQKIGNLILGTIIQQSARADVRPIIVEYNSSNGVFLGVGVA